MIVVRSRDLNNIETISNIYQIDKEQVILTVRVRVIKF